MFGAAWRHDGAAPGPERGRCDSCFVVAGIIVELTILTQPVSLLFTARLRRLKTGPSKVELAAGMTRHVSVCPRFSIRSLLARRVRGRGAREQPR